MGLRPARCYREWKRPYTRVAIRVPKKAYIKGVPGIKLRIFEMGTKENNYTVVVHLVSEDKIQIRHNALEAARVMANSYMRKNIGDKNYFLKIRIYPHHVLREHAQAAVAQADRYYQGMRRPFGKPVGRAAQIDRGQKIMTVWTIEEFLEKAKIAMKRAGYKLPCTTKVVVEPWSGPIDKPATASAEAATPTKS